MIETARVMLHSVVAHVKDKAVELLGFSVSGTLLIISQISWLDLIKEGLQIAMMIVSLAGGVMTFLYVHRKYQKLGK